MMMLGISKRAVSTMCFQSSAFVRVLPGGCRALTPMVMGALIGTAFMLGGCGRPSLDSSFKSTTASAVQKLIDRPIDSTVDEIKELRPNISGNRLDRVELSADEYKKLDSYTLSNLMSTGNPYGPSLAEFYKFKRGRLVQATWILPVVNRRPNDAVSEVVDVIEAKTGKSMVPGLWTISKIDEGSFLAPQFRTDGSSPMYEVAFVPSFWQDPKDDKAYLTIREYASAEAAPSTEPAEPDVLAKVFADAGLEI